MNAAVGPPPARYTLLVNVAVWIALGVIVALVGLDMVIVARTTPARRR